MSEQPVSEYLISRGELLDAETMKPVQAYRLVDAEAYRALLEENARLLSAGQALEADFSSFRREVEHKHGALQSRLDAVEAQLAHPDYPPKYSRRLIAELRQQLAERDARIHEARTMLGEIKEFHWRAECSEHRAALRRHVDLWLSASAEPAPCDTCKGQGEVYSGQDQHFHYFDFQPPEPIMDVCPECGGEPAKGGDGEVSRG